MKEILEKNKSVKILFEFHPQVLADYNTKPEELLQIIDKNGFKMFDVLQNNKLISTKELLQTYPNKINPSTNIFCERN